jgi:hypothetical protein
MDYETQTDPPDLSLLLPRDAYHHLAHTLRGSLPPPLADTPEDLARRDNAAIAEAASLLPINASEAALAAQFVAANAQAMDCLRLAQDPAMPLGFVVKCRAQAVSIACPGEGRGCASRRVRCGCSCASRRHARSLRRPPPRPTGRPGQCIASRG